MDLGVENLNGTVDPLFTGERPKRVLAQVDVTFYVRDHNERMPEVSEVTGQSREVT